jgi:hypothetical protein
MGGEYVAKTAFMKSLPKPIYYFFFNLSGACHICALIFVNIIGYAVGVQGVKHVSGKFLNSDGAKVLFGSLYILWWGVQIMQFLSRYDKLKVS